MPKQIKLQIPLNATLRSFFELQIQLDVQSASGAFDNAQVG